jgi:hypothetical protein
MVWGSSVEVERRNRIRVLLWAYAYEVHHDSLVSDGAFDEVCARIDVSIKTGRHDAWFKKNFDKSTGMWIHEFPAIKGIANVYERVKKNEKL